MSPLAKKHFRQRQEEKDEEEAENKDEEEEEAEEKREERRKGEGYIDQLGITHCKPLPQKLLLKRLFDRAQLFPLIITHLTQSNLFVCFCSKTSLNHMSRVID